MNIPAPTQIGAYTSDLHASRVEKMVDEFLAKVKAREFQYMSTDTEKLVMIDYYADHARPEVFADALAALNLAGWDVRYHDGYCASGPFKSIAWKP